MKRTTVRGIVRLAVRSGGTSLKAPRPGADDASAVLGWPRQTRHRDGTLLVVGLALADLLTRWATRSQVLYHWDSVNFALALEHYDIAAHQPHPPGYILYVLLGRLVHTVVGDANGSLVLISVLSSALLVPMAYGLGRDLFDRGTGVYAALLTSPAPWCVLRRRQPLVYRTCYPASSPDLLPPAGRARRPLRPHDRCIAPGSGKTRCRYLPCGCSVSSVSRAAFAQALLLPSSAVRWGPHVYTSAVAWARLDAVL